MINISFNLFYYWSALLKSIQEKYLNPLSVYLIKKQANQQIESEIANLLKVQWQKWPYVRHALQTTLDWLKLRHQLTNQLFQKKKRDTC